MKTLLKANEVIHWTGISNEFPPCDLRTIKKYEIKEFRDCLGKAFYEQLQNCLAEYECTHFEGNTTYQVGDIVVFDGLFYEATVATSNLPTVYTDWKLAQKFNSDCPCFNDLWCEGGLAEYLSWVVIKRRLPFIATQITGAGLVKLFGDKFSAAEQKDITSLQKAINAEIAISFENLDDYLKDNNESGCFNLYKGLAVDCCGSCGCKEQECKCEDNCLTKKKRKNKYRIA